MTPVQFRSVQFKMASMCSGKPICAPPHLSGVSPVLTPRHDAIPVPQFRSVQFNSRWYLCARESPYVLHPISQEFRPSVDPKTWWFPCDSKTWCYPCAADWPQAAAGGWDPQRAGDAGGLRSAPRTHVQLQVQGQQSVSQGWTVTLIWCLNSQPYENDAAFLGWVRMFDATPEDGMWLPKWRGN